MSSGHYCDDCSRPYYSCVCKTAVSAPPAAPPIQPEPVAWRAKGYTGVGWTNWRTDDSDLKRAEAEGREVQFAYASPPPAVPAQPEGATEVRRLPNGNVAHGCEMCDGEDECTCRAYFPPSRATMATVGRISRDEMLIEMATVVAKRSTCNRRHVGAVIAHDGRVVSTGYAGAPSGMPHCSAETCNAAVPCTRTVHAEAGAIAHAARHGVPIEGCTLYATCSPCIDCAKLIINAGITRLVYAEEYRKTEGLDLLRSAGIAVSQWSPTPPTGQELRTLP